MNIKIIESKPRVEIEMDKCVFDAILSLIGRTSCYDRTNVGMSVDESNVLSTFFTETKYYREKYK